MNMLDPTWTHGSTRSSQNGSISSGHPESLTRSSAKEFMKYSRHIDGGFRIEYRIDSTELVITKAEGYHKSNSSTITDVGSVIDEIVGLTDEEKEAHRSIKLAVLHGGHYATVGDALFATDEMRKLNKIFTFGERYGRWE